MTLSSRIGLSILCASSLFLVGQASGQNTWYFNNAEGRGANFILNDTLNWFANSDGTGGNPASLDAADTWLWNERAFTNGTFPVNLTINGTAAELDARAQAHVYESITSANNGYLTVRTRQDDASNNTITINNLVVTGDANNGTAARFLAIGTRSFGGGTAGTGIRINKLTGTGDVSSKSIFFGDGSADPDLFTNVTIGDTTGFNGRIFVRNTKFGLWDNLNLVEDGAYFQVSSTTGFNFRSFNVTTADNGFLLGNEVLTAGSYTVAQLNDLAALYSPNVTFSGTGGLTIVPEPATWYFSPPQGVETREALDLANLRNWNSDPDGLGSNPPVFDNTHLWMLNQRALLESAVTLPIALITNGQDAEIDARSTRHVYAGITVREGDILTVRPRVDPPGINQIQINRLSLEPVEGASINVRFYSGRISRGFDRLGIASLRGGEGNHILLGGSSELIGTQLKIDIGDASAFKGRLRAQNIELILLSDLNLYRAELQLVNATEAGAFTRVLLDFDIKVGVLLKGATIYDQPAVYTAADLNAFAGADWVEFAGPGVLEVLGRPPKEPLDPELRSMLFAEHTYDHYFPEASWEPQISALRNTLSERLPGAHPRLFPGLETRPFDQLPVLLRDTIVVRAGDLMDTESGSYLNLETIGDSEATAGYARFLNHRLLDLLAAWMITENPEFADYAEALCRALLEAYTPESIPKDSETTAAGIAMNPHAVGELLQALAIAYDLLHARLEEGFRRDFASAIANYITVQLERTRASYGIQGPDRSRSNWWAPYHNWTGVVSGSMGMAALAIEDEVEGFDSLPSLWTAISTVEKWLDLGFDSLGATMEGNHYFQLGCAFALPFMEALWARGGPDLFESSKVGQGLDYLAGEMLPMSPPILFNAWNTSNYTGLRWDYVPLLLARVYEDPLGMWIWENAMQTPHLHLHALSAFYYPFGLQTEDPMTAESPLFRFYSELGMANFRTGWTAGDVFFSFSSGPFRPTTHGHSDENNFTLYAYGDPEVVSSATVHGARQGNVLKLMFLHPPEPGVSVAGPSHSQLEVQSRAVNPHFLTVAVPAQAAWLEDLPQLVSVTGEGFAGGVMDWGSTVDFIAVGFNGKIAWNGIVSDARLLKIRFGPDRKPIGWVVIEGTFIEFDGDRLFAAEHPLDLIFDGEAIRSIPVNDRHRIGPLDGSNDPLVHVWPLASWLSKYNYSAYDLDTILVPKGTAMVSLRTAFLMGEDPHDPADLVHSAIFMAGEHQAEFSFQARRGLLYQLEVSTDLINWTDHGVPVSVDADSFLAFPVDMQSVDKRFFRLRISTP